MGRWAARAKAQCRMESGRSTDVKDHLAGPQRILTENGVPAHSYKHFSHRFIAQTCTEHMSHAQNCARYCRFSRNKAGTIPAVSKLSLQRSKFCREEFLVAKEHRI